MNLKHYKLLKTSGYINMFLGLAIIIIGIGEFMGIIQSNSSNIIQSMGVALSPLVFISGIFCALSGGLAVFLPKTNPKINLQVFAGVLSLGWPIFISVALLFAEHMICIRLLPTTLTSLFYIIAVLIVKITNEAFKKTHQLNPQAIFRSMGKRKGRVSIQRSLAKTGDNKKTISTHKLQSLGKLNNHRTPAFSPMKMLLNNTRRHSNVSFSNLLYSRSKRRRGKKRFR